MKIQLSHNFEDIISIDNLLLAWQEFIRGKRTKKDVQKFEFRLMDNIISLHNDLINFTYKHGQYQAFNISDPKSRSIHKATVRDRLAHRAVYRVLYSFFDKIFISDSFSCRFSKGTHKAINRFKIFTYKTSKNNTKTCWILKCDIRKFFASIDHKTLMNILKEYIPDERIIWLLEEIINSFNAKSGIGLPLGNLTSQLFANIYMNKVDQFMKHKLKVKSYIRYADDFVILSLNKEYLKNIVPEIESFLKNNLKLEIHFDKTSIKTIYSGQDFLGWINFQDHRILRITTKRRMLKRIKSNPNLETINSYLGLLSHGNTGKIKEKIFKDILFKK
ncbi:reverse transcriptase/maturase family protein [Patescibacteria group bacterium]|nr:reverse transcriptase/maturase family protein [Patescibacteria group bacterium]